MRKLAIKTAIAAASLMPATALAQEPLPAPITDPGDFITLLETVSQWLFAIFLALAVIFFLYAAFLYLTAGGNEATVGRARTVLIYSVVAVVVAVLAGGFVPLIRGILE
jgi:hypothetical protein